MNFAIDLVMAGIFLRLANLRSFGGFDIFPDFAGGLLILLAILIAKKKAGEIAKATLPTVLYTLVSLGGFYNFLHEESTAVHMGMYIVWQIAYISVEIWMYYKLMYALDEMEGYDVSGGDKGSLILYGASLFIGVIISYMVWQTVTVPSNTNPFALWTLIYYGYGIIHIIITAYLIYRFYIKKPKFR